MTPTQTLDQKRASHAWQVVQKVKRGTATAEIADPKTKLEREKQRKEFKTQVKKLPARVLAAGLGQALAFLEAKQYAPQLRDALSHWINTEGMARTADPQQRLLERVVHGDSDFLRYATAECLAYLQWMIRFADAVFADVPEGD
jgi:CRISPR-associated protein Cmr5